MLISVIIPVKNRSQELQRAIQSVLNQTVTDFEVLIIDDKSDEDISAVVSKFNDSRLSYVLNDKKISNANVCRNIGLDVANGQYVAMLDSDDEWLPNHLESKLDEIKRNDCHGVFGSAYVDDGENRVLRLSRPKRDSERMLDYLLTTGRAPTPTHFYLTECAQKIKWDESLNRHQDFDFSARFDQQFSFIASQEPTAIIHWEKGIVRTKDLTSQVMFIEKHKNQISPDILAKYLTEAYSISCQTKDNASKSASKYFKTLALSHMRFMSYADYQLVLGDLSSFARITSRISYALRVIFS